MATLLNTLQVKQVAFAWSGTTRVYEAHTIVIDYEDEGEDWVLSNQTKGWTDEGVWLFFEVMSDHFRRVSPSGSSGNDWTDVVNALRDPDVTVNFYPIYSVDNSVSYAVKHLRGRRRLLETKRTLFKPKAHISMEAVSIVDDLPTWARTSRAI